MWRYRLRWIFSIELHFVASHLTRISVTGGWSCWATVFIALWRNSEKSPVIISKPIKKLRRPHFLDQSPMEIKEQPCCTFKEDLPAMLFPQTFILTLPVFFYIFSMLDYETSFISFHLFLTFRNSEEHPSKFSNRPIFKVFFFLLPAEVSLSTSFPKAFSIHGAQQS